MKKAVKGLLPAALAVFTIFALQQGALLAQAPILGNDHKLEGAWEAVIWLPTDPTHPATTTFAPTPYRILRTVAPADHVTTPVELFTLQTDGVDVP